MGLSWVRRATLGFPFSHCIVRFGSHDANICKCTDSFFTQKSLVTRKTSYPWLFNLLTLALLQGFSPVVMNLKQRHLSHNSRQSKSKLQCMFRINAILVGTTKSQPDYVTSCSSQKSKGFLVTISKTILLTGGKAVVAIFYRSLWKICCFFAPDIYCLIITSVKYWRAH